MVWIGVCLINVYWLVGVVCIGCVGMCWLLWWMFLIGCCVCFCVLLVSCIGMDGFWLLMVWLGVLL